MCVEVTHRLFVPQRNRPLHKSIAAMYSMQSFVAFQYKR